MWLFTLRNSLTENAARSSTQKSYYPTKLVDDGSSDCYTNGVPISSGGMPPSNYVRWITYTIVDQNGAPWNVGIDGSLTISEIIVPTGGTKIVGGGVWSTNANSPDERIDGAKGTFVDELTLGGLNSAIPAGTANQVFYGSGNFIAQPLQVQINGRTFGVLSNLYTANTVRVAGTSTTQRCK